jgi:branched-chain amino acid aminotransferase
MLWLDGDLVAPSAARIDPADRGLLLGDGLFETMRAVAGRVPLLDRHLARLRAGAEELGIPVPYDDVAIAAASAAVLAADRLADAALRLTLTRGPGPRGLPPPPAPRPTLLLAAFPLPSPPLPARAILATVTRRNERSPLLRLKTLSYLDSLLALREAQGRGADEALLLNTAGRLACATTANLFLIEPDGRLATPPPSEGVLPGITRGLIIELADELGVACVEEPLPPARLRSAAGTFLTGSLAGIRPLLAVDDWTVGAGEPHPLALRLQAAWRTRLGIA